MPSALRLANLDAELGKSQLPTPNVALFRSGSKSRKSEVLRSIFTVFLYLLPKCNTAWQLALGLP